MYYNNLDVGPFVTALEGFMAFYKEKNIDVFKTSVSVPGVARKMLFNIAKENGTHFSLFSKDDEDLYRTVKQNIVGGPSIVFNRHHKTEETFIRSNAEKPCQKIVGYDANALYLWAIGENMPTGNYVRWHADGQRLTGKTSNTKYMTMFYWLDYLAKKEGITILHKLNNGQEKRVGPYLVDGFNPATNTIYEVSIVIQLLI